MPPSILTRCDLTSVLGYNTLHQLYTVSAFPRLKPAHQPLHQASQRVKQGSFQIYNMEEALGHILHFLNTAHDRIHRLLGRATSIIPISLQNAIHSTVIVSIKLGISYAETTAFATHFNTITPTCDGPNSISTVKYHANFERYGSKFARQCNHPV